jgi:hypothetical protein
MHCTAKLSINRTIDGLSTYISCGENKVFVNFLFKFKIWDEANTNLFFFEAKLMISFLYIFENICTKN